MKIIHLVPGTVVKSGNDTLRLSKLCDVDAKTVIFEDLGTNELITFSIYDIKDLEVIESKDPEIEKYRGNAYNHSGSNIFLKKIQDMVDSK